MIIIGLTGSIGMGKTTATTMLESLGVPVHDSDAEVHDLLADKNGQAYAAICAAFPYFEYPKIYKDRKIDRQAFGKIIFTDDSACKKLEAILHPLVRAAQDVFIRSQKNAGRKIIALDIPLLFETGAQERVDFTMVVTAPADIQRTRVFERENMDEDKFQAILARQMSDAEKCELADYTIKTGVGRAETMQQIKQMLEKVKNDQS